MSISEQTLFERIRNADAPRDPSMTLDRSRLMRSVADNLSRILASRVGHAPAQMDYGMPDPVEIAMTYPASVDRLRKALKECIERYEPRLVDVQVLMVETEDDDRNVRLVVRAGLRGNPAEKISIDTSVDSAGKLQVNT